MSGSLHLSLSAAQLSASAGLTGALAGGALAAALVRRPSTSRAPVTGAAPAATQPGRPPDRTAGAPTSLAVIDALPVAVAVMDGEGEVVMANRAADVLGLRAGSRLAPPELRRLVRETRRAGAPTEAELDLSPGRLGRLGGPVRVRLAPVGDSAQVALLVEDLTEARRVEAVRRDFVANVSHELKTPVGAMALLAEALGDASEDPLAVRRFAGRVQTEASRLGRLVQELIDLSRLQGADPLPDPVPVEVDRVVTEAVDRSRIVAAARDVDIIRGGDNGLVVLGSEQQLVTALSNLLDNAVHYSAERTRVAVAVRSQPDMVEISVTDQGIGIAERDLERVFERFYRADPARSRATGGTGLGLAIVKHVATNHGGEVGVWSTQGAGSTFTLRLPAAPPDSTPGTPVRREP